MCDHVTTLRQRILLGLLLIGGLLLPLGQPARALDLPTAPASPIAGIAFDDPPLLLPVQRNFQMAMLLSSSELGRSCGKMEAYGWRLSDEEQPRVNQIFNNTVDRLRAQGFAVETKSAGAVSRDVTLFAADRSDKHLIFLWSAGEIGLVMVLCETSAPLSPIPSNVNAAAALRSPPQAATLPMPLTPAPRLALPERQNRRGDDNELSTVLGNAPSARLTRTGKPVSETFKPEGAWVGSYTCGQGTTGATLRINKLKGDQFDGVFSFYPSAKNPYVPKGSYHVFGEYDRDSLRILINPGKWIERPKAYENTIMIGSFDPVAGTFSGYFQGIMGCTSFEARYDRDAQPKAKEPIVKKAKAKKAAKKKAIVKPVTQDLAPDQPVLSSVVTPEPAATPATSGKSDLPEAGIIVGAPSTTP